MPSATEADDDKPTPFFPVDYASQILQVVCLVVITSLITDHEVRLEIVHFFVHLRSHDNMTFIP